MKFLSFVVILLLIASNIPIGFADTIPQIDSSLNDESPLEPVTQIRKSISINLEEDVGLSSKPPTKNEMINVPKYTDTISLVGFDLVSIHLNEDLQLLTSYNNQKIHFNAIISQPQIILERISPSDKPRDDRKKNSKDEISYLDGIHQKDSSDVSSLIESPISQPTLSQAQILQAQTPQAQILQAQTPQVQILQVIILRFSVLLPGRLSSL